MSANSGYVAPSGPAQDFFRTAVGGALPDGSNDTTEGIRRLGGVGIGGASITEAIPAIVGATATNNPLHLSNAAAGRGQVLFGLSPLSYYLQRTQSAVLNERVDIGQINGGLGGYMLRMSISTSDSANVATKYYLIAMSWHLTGGGAQIVTPERASPVLGNNDFELIMSVNNQVGNFWVRRKSGSDVGIYRIRIEVIGDGTQTFQEFSTVVVDAVAYSTYTNELSQTTEWYLGGQEINDARWNKIGNIYRRGRVAIGTLRDIGNPLLNYSDVTLVVSAETQIPVEESAFGTVTTGKVLRLHRGGTSGSKFPLTADFALGSYFADGNARTRVDFNLANATNITPDTNVMTWLANGSIGMGNNIPFARIDHKLNLEGGGKSMAAGIALRLNGLLHPAVQINPFNYDNNWHSFDGWYQSGGAGWQASHTTRPYAIYKKNGNLEFIGMAVAPAAAGAAWVLDTMMSMRYAGSTLPGGELWFQNVIKNRRVVLFDANIASDHQFYGFGINGSTLRYQVDQVASAHRWFAATGPTASNEIMSLLGTGRLGVNTPNPLTPAHFQELGAATLPIISLQNTSGIVREFIFTGATPNAVLTGSPGDRAVGVTSPGSVWVKATGVNTNTGWVQVAARAFYAATGVTDAAGNVTFTFPVSMFSVTPVLTIGVQTAVLSVNEARIIALTSASCTINVNEGNPFNNLAGATVHIMATTTG